MSFTRKEGQSILLPENVADLLVQPMIDASVAARVARVTTTTSSTFRIPVVTADAKAAWVAEGEEIPASSMTISEVLVQPAKLAGRETVSRELADDSNPAALEAVGDSLARDIARQLDAAFFGSKGTNLSQPAGLLDLAGINAVVSTGTGWTNLDAFVQGKYLAEKASARLTAWVANPDDAVELATIKRAAGSNEPLLGPDPSEPGRSQILGLPLHVSPGVPEGIIWGIPRDRAYLVIREGATVEFDSSVFFTSDRIAVRAIMRVAWGFPHPAAMIQINKGGLGG